MRLRVLLPVLAALLVACGSGGGSGGISDLRGRAFLSTSQTAVADHLKNVPSTVRPIVRAARRVVKSAAAKAEEVAYQRRPTRSRSAMWKLTRYRDERGNVAGIGVFPTYACLYFYRGRELADENGLLEGGGKDMRFVRLRAAADAERPTVKRLVRGAFKLGSKP